MVLVRSCIESLHVKAGLAVTSSGEVSVVLSFLTSWKLWLVFTEHNLQVFGLPGRCLCGLDLRVVGTASPRISWEMPLERQISVSWSMSCHQNFVYINRVS